MPIQNSFGALHIPTNNNPIGPIIGGNGWIGKLNTRAEVSAIVAPAIADPGGVNKVVSLISQYSFSGNTYPSTMLITNNTGDLELQANTGISFPRNGSLSRNGATMMMIGINQSNRATISRLSASVPAITNAAGCTTDTAYYANIVCSGDGSTSNPAFYITTAPSSSSSGVSVITKFAQTSTTFTETWTKRISAIISGLVLKYIYSDVANVNDDVYVAGTLESTTGGLNKIYFAKLNSTGTFYWEKTIEYTSNLDILGFTEGYIMCSNGIFISFNSVTGDVSSAALLAGYTSSTCQGIVLTASGQVATINRDGYYIPDLTTAFNYGTVTARKITNLTDPDSQWSSIGQIGSTTLTTNNGVVLGGLGITASSDFYAITMQVPFNGKIPYSGTYVLDGKTFAYSSITTVSASNVLSNLTIASVTLTWNTTTIARTQSSSGGAPNTYTYNKINIGS